MYPEKFSSKFLATFPAFTQIIWLYSGAQSFFWTVLRYMRGFFLELASMECLTAKSCRLYLQVDLQRHIYFGIDLEL